MALIHSNLSLCAILQGHYETAFSHVLVGLRYPSERVVLLKLRVRYCLVLAWARDWDMAAKLSPLVRRECEVAGEWALSKEVQKVKESAERCK